MEYGVLVGMFNPMQPPQAEHWGIAIFFLTGERCWTAHPGTDIAGLRASNFSIKIQVQAGQQAGLTVC